MSIAIPTDGSGVILKEGVLAIGVCVPNHWTDEQVAAWANSAYLCGTSAGWHVRKEGDVLVTAESPERSPCEKDSGRVHLVLDC